MTTRAPAVLKKIDQRLTMFLKRLVIGLLWQLIEMYLFKEITLNKVILVLLIIVKSDFGKKNAKLIKREF